MVEFDSRIGETSAELHSLFDAQDVPRANDTSVGTGYAPLSETDRIIRGLEPELREQVPAIGEDINLMGWRTDDEHRITVAAAVVSRYVSDIDEYVEVIEQVAEIASRYASERTDRAVHVDVNAAERVHRTLGADHTEVKLLSQIGTPVTDPIAIDVDTTARDDEAIRRIVGSELDTIESLTRDLVAGDVSLFNADGNERASRVSTWTDPGRELGEQSNRSI